MTKSGEWVVFGPAASVRVGRITVAKRDGSTKVEEVERIGKPFQVDGVAYVYGYVAARESRPATASRSRARHASSGRCRMRGCTAPATSSGLCRDCHFDEYDQ
jgi:hypothetical protein